MRELSKQHEIFLCSISNQAPSLEAIKHLSEFCGVVDVQLVVRGVVRKAFDVCRSLFGGMPYIVNANYSSKLRKIIPELVEGWGIDVLQMDELCVAGNLDFSKIPIPIVLHAHNCEGPLAEQIATNTKSRFLAFYRKFQANKLVEFEREIARKVDVVVAVSKEDRSYFGELNKSTFCAPNGVPAVVEGAKPKRSGSDLLFVGTLVYPPNDEGVRWFLKEVLPLVKESFPDLRMKVIGRKPSFALKSLAGAGVSILTDVEEIGPYLTGASLMVVPLFSGGGSRLKILEAFAAGLPVVSTSVGASGLDVVDGEHALLADTAKDFAEKIVEILSCPARGQSLAESARCLVKDRYLWSNISPVLSDVYERVVGAERSTEVSPFKLKPRILLSIPHSTLLGPQGHRERFDGVVSLLEDFDLSFLLPSSTPEKDLVGLPRDRLFFFDEPRFFSIDIPFFLDFSRNFQVELERVVRIIAADVVVFDFPWGLSRFAKRSAVPVVYFSHGVEQEFAEVVLRDRGLDISLLNRLFRALIGAIESRACKEADLVLAMSERDRKLLSEATGASLDKMMALAQPVLSSRVVEDPKKTRMALDLPIDRDLIVFHGSARHFPNRIAMELIEKELCPTLAKLWPAATVVVAGPGVPAKREGNLIHLGFVEDLGAFLSCCDVAVVPILEGSGVRMKILDYFSSRVPVVSTAKGIEGLDVVAGREAIVSDNSIDSLTKELLSLLADKSKQESLVAEASSYLEHQHDHQALSSCLQIGLSPLLSFAVKR